MDGRRKPRSAWLSQQAAQPARVTLVGEGGDRMNVTINKIHGRITVSNLHKETHYHANGVRMNTKNNCDTSESSDTDSDTDSDDAQFFAQYGAKMPSKEDFRQLSKLSKMMSGAFPGDPKSAQLQTETRVQHQPTRIESQTLKFREIVRKIPHSDRALDESMIYKISPYIGQGWRRVFRHLHLSDAEIDDAYVETGEVKEAVQKLLVTWTRICKNPTIAVLLEALVRSDQNTIIQKLSAK